MDWYYYFLNFIIDSDFFGFIICGIDRDDSGKLLRWKMVENNCVSECLFMFLFIKSNGFVCWNCVNECKGN